MKHKIPAQKTNNLSDLDSFSLDSISSSVNSLITTTSQSCNNNSNSYNDDNSEFLENDDKNTVINLVKSVKEDLSEVDDGGDWIQVKKPARNITSYN